MIKTKTWDDYLTESAKCEEASSPKVSPVHAGAVGNTIIGKSSRNPFLKNITDHKVREVTNADATLNVITSLTSEPVISSLTTETSLTETVLRHPGDKNTLDSLDSLDSYGFGETKVKPTRERFLLFDNRESVPSRSSKLRKEVFDNHLKEAMKSTRLFTSTKLRHRNELKGPKIFGGNFKYMKGYLKSALPLSEIEKENKSMSENPSSSNDAASDLTAKLQQELKSSRRKIQNLKDMNGTAVRRKDELQEEVLSAHKEITDLKIALQTSCDKQHEFEIEMRIAKARVGEAEREAAIAIGQSNKLERDVQDQERKRQSNWDKLITAEQKINTLEESLNLSKEEHRQDIELKHQFHQHLEAKQYELKRGKKEIDSLKADINEREKEKLALYQQSEQIMQEKAKCEGQIEELSKSNVSLKEEYNKLLTIHNVSQRTVEACNQRVIEQKEKFDAMIASRVQIEGEISEIHKELSRQKNEKQILSAECSRLLESYNQSEASAEKYRKQYETLEKENSNLRDKILYLGLYKKVIDTKSLTLDELKSSESVIPTSKKNPSPKVTSKAENSSVPESQNMTRLHVDLEKITKKLEEMNEEHRRIQKDVDPTVTKDPTSADQLSPKEEQQTSGSQSPFELSINETKQSIFPTFMTTINRQESFSNMYSALVDADNKNIANALL